MTPPTTASARPTGTSNPTTTTNAGTAGADTDAGPVVRLRPTDGEWADRYAAIDLIAQRLHNDQCATGPDNETCSLTHWMAWTRPAVVALADAHVHTHYHTTGKRVVIEIDLPPDPDTGHGNSRSTALTGGVSAAGRWCA